MANVTLKAGESVDCIWATMQETPFGSVPAQVIFTVSYEDLMKKFAIQKSHRSRKSRNEGTRFSRIVSLSSSAIIKGLWSNGARIDRDAVFSKLVMHFNELDKCSYGDITNHAKQSLLGLTAHCDILSNYQRQEVIGILEEIQSGK